MTAATIDGAPPSILRSGQQSTARKLRNHLATAMIILTVAIALVPLYFVIAFVIRKGGATFGWSFLTQDPPILDQLSGGGMFPAIVGTLVITAGATLLAVPLGVLGAIYLNEYGQQRRLARVIRFLAEIMLGVPSIVMGLFVFTVITLHFKTLRRRPGARLPDPPDRDPHQRGDAAPRPRGAAGGELRARQPQGAHHPHRRAAQRRARDRERRAARRRARRG